MIFSPFQVLLKFETLVNNKNTSAYFIEFYKINQDNLFKISHPYTLVYRSDESDATVYFLESRISNQDFDRVLKIELYKKESYKKKGFTLTTLRHLLSQPNQTLKVDRVDSRVR